MSIFQVLMVLFVCIYRSSCIYEDVNYPFENDLYILKIP